MTEIKQRLFDAFKADHTLLGSGFHTLATCLRDDDIAGAKAIAAKIGIEAGPHITFEEEAFYPALKRFLGQDDLDAMYLEHNNGRALLETVLRLDESVELTEARKQTLLAEVNKFETHVSECGELFGAMGGLSDTDLQHLLEKLISYRLQAPNWLSSQTTVSTNTGNTES